MPFMLFILRIARFYNTRGYPYVNAVVVLLAGGSYVYALSSLVDVNLFYLFHYKHNLKFYELLFLNNTRRTVMNKNLFEEFPPVPTKDWMALIEKDLKGADFEKKLVFCESKGAKSISTTQINFSFLRKFSYIKSIIY
jgi:hypothetical protein